MTNTEKKFVRLKLAVLRQAAESLVLHIEAMESDLKMKGTDIEDIGEASFCMEEEVTAVTRASDAMDLLISKYVLADRKRAGL